MARCVKAVAAAGTAAARPVPGGAGGGGRSWMSGVPWWWPGWWCSQFWLAFLNVPLIARGLCGPTGLRSRRGR